MIIFQDITYIDRMENATYIEHNVMDMLEGRYKHLALYLWLKRLHNKKAGYAYPNIRHNKRTNPNPKTKDLVTLMGCSDNTVVKLLKDLEDMLLIEIIKDYGTNGSRSKNRYKIYQPYEIEEKYLDVIYDERTMKMQKTTTANSGHL